MKKQGTLSLRIYLRKFMLKKIFNFFLLFSLLSIFSIALTEYLVVSKTSQYIYTQTQDIPDTKVWLVLGTSKYIADGRRNLFYIYRLDAVKDLYDAEKIEYILVSGDNSTQQYNETDTMKRDLIEMWIPEDKIYGDYAGFRTLDSVVRAKEIFGQSEYIIISQGFHLERALYLAQSEGIEAIWYPAQDVPVRLAPRVWIRERLARVKMMLDIMLWVEPKFWGERIEIGGL